MLTKRHLTSAFLLLLLPFASHAIVILDATTAGRYNNGLGDLAALDGPGGFFLGPNISEGDPILPPVIAQPAVVYGSPRADEPRSFGARLVVARSRSSAPHHRLTANPGTAAFRPRA